MPGTLRRSRFLRNSRSTAPAFGVPAFYTLWCTRCRLSGQRRFTRSREKPRPRRRRSLRCLRNAPALALEPVDDIARHDDAARDDSACHRNGTEGDEQCGATLVGTAGEPADLLQVERHIARLDLALRVVD